MRRIALGMAAATMLLGMACAEDVTLIEKKTVTAQSLSGFVGPDAPGVLVEECEKNWGQISSVTTTDEYGHFELPEYRKARTHYIRVTLNDGKKLLWKVHLKSSAPELMLPARTNVEIAGK